jgi:hypothetical protein
LRCSVAHFIKFKFTYRVILWACLTPFFSPLTNLLEFFFFNCQVYLLDEISIMCFEFFAIYLKVTCRVANLLLFFWKCDDLSKSKFKRIVFERITLYTLHIIYWNNDYSSSANLCTYNIEYIVYNVDGCGVIYYVHD